MEFYTLEEFTEKYTDYADFEIPEWYVMASSEMIFSQVGKKYQDTSWTSETVPTPIKNASMEQLRFMIDHDIPFVDTDNLDAGNMKSKIKSDYSTLALRILGNAGYLYRGNPINSNMSLNMPFGD